MDDEDSRIKTRLVDVLNSILCPAVGCWPLHGGHSENYFDSDAESHVLEVWPIGIEPPEEHEGNGYPPTDPSLLYELAEFDFTGLAKEIPLEHFHFSQRRSIFEIGWEENGQQLELRVHLVPVEVADDL
jgi:hypothetical protein